MHQTSKKGQCLSTTKLQGPSDKKTTRTIEL